MADEWIIRVDGKEYGPADLPTLHEWKTEGRVLAANDARRNETETWTKAETIPGLFEASRPSVQVTESLRPTPVSTRALLPETFVIYTRGFFQYLGLTLLLLGPSLLAQLVGALIDTRSSVEPGVRTLVAGAFAGCMVILWLVLIPVYIAGIQILTAAFAAGERISFFAVLNEAVKYWPRVAFLWVFVLACYAFWIFIPVGIIGTLALSGPSLGSIFLALIVLAVMVWVVGRLFVNFMFWQQFAVLEGCNIPEALQRSRELARSGSELPWYRRPLWRGVFIVSLWSAVVIVLYWPFVSQLFGLWVTQLSHTPVTSGSDSQKMAESLFEAGKNIRPSFAAGILKEVLKPLLGIAFVILFLDSNLARED
jgi:hypothetical protein